MSRLPIDIENKIDQLFSASSDNQEVKKIILGLSTIPLNVGVEQLARSILILSEGSIEKLKDIFKQNFYGDPRDVIMMAEEKLGNPGHYFILPFDNIANAK